MNANDPTSPEAANGAGPAAAANEPTPTPAPAPAQADLEARHAELSDAYLRAKAEAENTRRRAEEEMAKARKFAVENFAESLLPVRDSLEAAIAIPAATPEQLLEGVHATLRQLTTALERNKVVEVNPPAGREVRPAPAPGDQRGPGRAGAEHGGRRPAEGLHDRRPRPPPGAGHRERFQLSDAA